VAIALGLVWGSFLNVVIHRVPRDESLLRPASRCPACGKPIKPWDNVPVVSFVLLRGRARCCKARISPRYPLVELLGGLLAWAVLETRVMTLPLETEAWRAALLFALYATLGLGLLAAAFIDLEHMILPDSITLGGAALGFASVALRDDVSWLESLLGAGIGFAIVWLPFLVLYPLIRGQPGMGLGDAKLTLLAGAWSALAALHVAAVRRAPWSPSRYTVRQDRGAEAVRRERESLAEIEAAEGEERRAEEELADPIALAPESGLGRARLAFGPFLVLAALEYLLFGKLLVAHYLAWLWSA
jgi:leader peptidase (prepilin peptidase)/N-methyltransferase